MRFNPYPVYKTMRCFFEGCTNPALHRFIGCTIPDTAPDLAGMISYKAVNETYLEAKEIMGNGPALDKLTAYLYFKVRTFSYGQGDALAVKICKRLAKSLLNELKIGYDDYIDDFRLNEILKQVGVYSEDMRL
jgi:hypothetical protein